MTKVVKFVMSDEPSNTVGVLVLNKDKTVTAIDVAEVVFDSLKRAYQNNPPSDEKLFEILASGWSNGPVMAVREEK